MTAPHKESSAMHEALAYPPDIQAAQPRQRQAADELAEAEGYARLIDDPDLVVVLAADLITAQNRQLEIEALALDPTGHGRCCERHCLACGNKSFGCRSTFEASPECLECGSSDVRVDEASYPRHTEETLRVHIARRFGDTEHRDLYTEAQAYLRRHQSDDSRCRDIRALSRVRHCRARSSHRAVAKPTRSHRTVAKPTVGGDSGDEPPGEPPGNRRRPSSGVASW
jgi:hypothetical protein